MCSETYCNTAVRLGCRTRYAPRKASDTSSFMKFRQPESPVVAMPSSKAPSLRDPCSPACAPVIAQTAEPIRAASVQKNNFVSNPAPHGPTLRFRWSSGTASSTPPTQMGRLAGSRNQIHHSLLASTSAPPSEQRCEHQARAVSPKSFPGQDKFLGPPARRKRSRRPSRTLAYALLCGDHRACLRPPSLTELTVYNV